MLPVVILTLLVLQGVNSDPVTVESKNETVFRDFDLGDCTDLGNATKVGHVGWPIYFNCDDIISPAKTANLTIYRLYRNKIATVTLLNADGTVSWNFTDVVTDLRYETHYPYEKFEVTENMDLPFMMVYKIPEISYCSKIQLYIQHERVVENATCTYPEVSPSEYYTKYKGSFSIRCEVNFGTFPKIFADPEDLEYEWWYNCTKNFPENIRGVTSKALTVSKVEFYNGGEYTCAVKYKGQRRFLTPHSLCVRHGNSGTYTIKCQENVEGREGQNLNITCTVDFGKGEAFNYHYRMSWMKMLENGTFHEICGAHPYHGLLNSTDGDPRIQCENVKVEEPGKCYRYVPSLEEQIAPDRTFRLTILFNDFQKSDVGRYLLNFTVFSNDFQNHTLTISLNEDSYITRRATYFAVAVAVLLILVSLLVFCMWRRRDILWFVKKHFGPYEQDDIEYMAYLAYHYSAEDMKQSTQNLTKNIVASLTKFIEKLNGTAYDDSRDGDPTRQHVESISKFQEKCHRIIVVLNEEYITDQWNMHKVYNAMQTMIEGGTKVIFIVLPGVDKTFKGLANESRIALKHAMQMSTTIQWSGKLPLNGSFRRQLEYALPKLKKGGEKLLQQNNNNRMQTVV